MTTNLEAVGKKPYIYYLVKFQYRCLNALVDSINKINAITLDFAIKLRLISRLTNVDVQKINNTYLQRYDMTTVEFSL